MPEIHKFIGKAQYRDAAMMCFILIFQRWGFFFDRETCELDVIFLALGCCCYIIHGMQHATLN